MQTRIMYSLIALLISASVFSQQKFYSSTNNNRVIATLAANEMKQEAEATAKEASFEFSIVPDKIATAFRLYISNPESKKIRLQISHPVYGEVVDTSFTSDQFSCRYNFERVEDGNYEITLTSGKEKIKRSVEINTVTRRNLVVR